MDKSRKKLQRLDALTRLRKIRQQEQYIVTADALRNKISQQEKIDFHLNKITITIEKNTESQAKNKAIDPLILTTQGGYLSQLNQVHQGLASDYTRVEQGYQQELSALQLTQRQKSLSEKHTKKALTKYHAEQEKKHWQALVNEKVCTNCHERKTGHEGKR